MCSKQVALVQYKKVDTEIATLKSSWDQIEPEH